MEPLEIRKSTIDSLRNALDKMGESEWEEQIKKLSPEERERATLLKIACNFAEVALVNAQLEDILAQLKQHEEELTDGTKRLEKALENLKQVKVVLDAASSLLGLIGKVVTVATVPHVAPLAIINDLMKARSDHDLRMVRSRLRDTNFFAMEPESNVELATIPEFHLEEKAPLFLIEEVLYGVELTPEKLIITVATGGCTEGGDFRFAVNKTASPYIVTVYRIVSDDCKGAFEPIKIAFSREKLGLDGLVEFILRNKIGNTSQHRLNI